MSDWIVEVSTGGEPILTIGDDFVSGKVLTPEDEDSIREAAESLLAFVGKPGQ